MSFKQFLTELKKVKAYAFDVDDTLLKTDATVKVLDKSGEIVTKLTPQGFNTYKLKDGETYDFSDFVSKDVLNNTAMKTDYFKIAQNVNNAVERGDSNSEIYIITARPDSFKTHLFDFLKRNGLSTLKSKNVFTVGGKTSTLTLAQLKKSVLKRLKKQHSIVSFYDDDDKNIDLAKELKTIKTHKVKV